MRKTIEQIMDTEKTAAEIIASAEKKASSIVIKNDEILLHKLNKFRDEEQKRYNLAVEQAELAKSEAIRKIKEEEPGYNADLEEISDKVLKRVMKTVFD